MKSKKSLLVALVLALCIVIGCTATSCRASSARNQQGSDVAPTIIVTRPDYSGDIKVHTIYKSGPIIDEFTDLVNKWLEDNRDKIAEAISSFVKEYNDTLQAASKSDLVNVVRNAEWMAGGSKSNEKLLASVGVAINEDNALSFDKDIFAKASLTTAKSVFDGNTSFAHQVANRATKIYAEAASAGTATATYSQKADYINVTTGNMLDSLM